MGRGAAFAVDAAVMSHMRRMRAADVASVARLHQTDMGRGLWGRLGVQFLETLYRGMIGSRYFLGFVYEEDGRLGGFIAGTSDGRRLFRDVIARCGARLIWYAFLGVLRSPALLLPLLATPSYFRRSGGTDAIAAESMFCSFVPSLRGRRVSGHINKILFDELAWLGHAHVKITTEADNAAAIRQLESWAFERIHTFHFYGKEMLTFVLDLRKSPRVEPRQFG